MDSHPTSSVEAETRSRIKRLFKLPLAALVLLAVLSASFSSPVLARVATPTLEHTETWLEPDFLTKVFGICAVDFDGDRDVEIVSYDWLNSFEAGGRVELRIATWNGEVFTVERSIQWQLEGEDTEIPGRNLYCGDVDGDGTLEILTSAIGETNPGVPDVVELRIWSSTRLLPGIRLEASRLWNINGAINGITAMDLDGDGRVEIFTAGYEKIAESNNAQVRVLRWDGGVLTEEYVQTWHVNGWEAFGVGAGDFDGDGIVEIAVASQGVSPAVTEVVVLRWDGTGLSPEASSQWRPSPTYPPEPSLVTLDVGDLDRDGLPEIVTVGKGVYQVEPYQAALIAVWRVYQSELTVVRHEEWFSAKEGMGPEFFDVQIADVDKDGFKEAVAAGATNAREAGRDTGYNLLRVYSWDGNSDLVAEFTSEWIPTDMDSSFAYATYCADVDRDRSVEILTGGRGALGTDYGEIDIWEVKLPVVTVTSTAMPTGLGFPGLRVTVDGRHFRTPFRLALEGEHTLTAPSTARCISGLNVWCSFQNWADETGVLTTSTSLTYDVQSDKTFNAVYKPPQYTLTLRVFEESSRQPLADAEVYLDGVSYGATDSRGAFVIQSVYAGSHELRITKDGFWPYTTTISLTRDLTQRVYLTRLPPPP